MPRDSVKIELFGAIFAQALRYLSPLLMYPFLTRAVGLTVFAKFALLVASAQVLTNIIEFGFGMLGARDINQGASGSASRVSGVILIGRIVTFAIALIAYILFMKAYNWHSDDNWEGVFAVIFLAVGYGMNASWFFMSRSESHKFAAIELLSSLMQFLLIIALARGKISPEELVIIFAIPPFASALFCGAWAVYKIGFSMPSFAEMRGAMAASFNFFIATGFPQLAISMALLICAASIDLKDVAYYTSSDKIIMGVINITYPVVRVFMPKISQVATESVSKSFNYCKNVVYCGVILATIFVIFLITTSKFTSFFITGVNSEDAVLILIALSLAVPIMAVSRLVGMIGLVSIGMEGEYKKHSVVSYVFLLVSCYPFCKFFGVFGLIASRIVAELYLALRLWLSYRRRVAVLRATEHHLGAVPGELT